jgi:hypothetical protein
MGTEGSEGLLAHGWHVYQFQKPCHVSAHDRRCVCRGRHQRKWSMPDDWRTIQAWYAAKSLAGRRGNGSDLFVNPSFEEVRTQFIRLFPKIKVPAEWTIRKTLQRRGLPLRTIRPGRPKGSKDTYKRERRNNSHRNRLTELLVLAKRRLLAMRAALDKCCGRVAH